jgi:DinB superfamily
LICAFLRRSAAKLPLLFSVSPWWIFPNWNTTQTLAKIFAMDSGHANSRTLPPHLASIQDDLEQSDQTARRIAGGLSDEQANWQPREGAWSIAQCLDHLGRGNTLYAAALHEAVSKNRTRKDPRAAAIQPGWFGRYFIRTLEPPPRRKLRSPRKIVPASRIGAVEVLDAFLRADEALRSVIREGAELDLNRIRFHNPFIGFLRFSVGTGLLVITAHNRRHLWQAERVLESPSFPKS